MTQKASHSYFSLRKRKKKKKEKKETIDMPKNIVLLNVIQDIKFWNLFHIENIQSSLEVRIQDTWIGVLWSWPNHHMIK